MGDASAVRSADEAPQRPVAFNADAFRQRVRDLDAQLGVVAGKQLGRVELVHAGDSTGLGPRARSPGWNLSGELSVLET